MTPNASEINLIDRWQRDFPLTERPFAEIGRKIGFDEMATIETFQRMRDAGAISRIGAVVRPHTVGASTLAAMRVPSEQMERVINIVNREPMVNHNYERTHALNLWFVIAGPDVAAVASTIDRIEENSGIDVLDLPLQRAYHIDLGFSLAGAQKKNERRKSLSADHDYCPEPVDRILLAAIEEGLPITSRPYREVAEKIGFDEKHVLSRLHQLAAAGVVTRFGCVVRHRALGYAANAMAVWDIADTKIDEVADQFIRHPKVTLCYRRPRRLPEWPYNLFCMVHAKSRYDGYAAIDELNLVADTGLNKQAVLFSTRCFKQRGAVFSHRAGEPK
jgi:DNA-binding Lrp family transcriptional regulator